MAMQNPAQSRNPDGTPFAHESQPGGPLLRLVLVYPAMLDAPFLVPMEFSATGSEAKRHGDTVAIDLAGRYGAHGRETYFKSFEPDPSPDEYLVYSDEYLVYFNMSRRLPRNAALCKVLGVDPQRPGARPMFRGDVVVATSKTNDAWEGLSATYTERTYFDFPAANMAFVGELIKRWYQSTAWAEMRFKDEQDYELPPGAIPPTWDWRNPTHIPGFAYDAYDDEERRHEMASRRLVDADNRRQERYERFAARRCAGCGKGELPTRSICSRCRNACYCSPVCQKAHWKEHKQYCQSPELPTS